MTEAKAGTRARGSAIATLFTYRLAGAFVVAYPAARTLGAFGPMTSPIADQALFEPGGYHLLEALRLAGSTIPALGEAAVLVLTGVGILGLLPLGFASTTLASPGATVRARLERTLAVLPRLLVLGGGTLLARALLLLLGLLIVGAGSALGERWTDERMPALLGAVCAVPFLVLWLLLGITQDLARAAVVRRDADVGDGLARALRVLGGRPLAVAASYGILAVSGIAVVLAAGWVAGTLDVSRAGEARVWGTLAVHQGAVLVLVTLRVAWLALTLAVVGERPSTDETPGASTVGA